MERLRDHTGEDPFARHARMAGGGFGSPGEGAKVYHAAARGQKGVRAERYSAA